MPIEQAAQHASTVVVGTVVGTGVEQSSDGVRTAVRLWVDESLKGGASGVTTFYVPGGQLPDGSAVVVDSMASFAPGEICCVFADARGWVIGGYQGKVHLGGTGFGATSSSQSAVLGRVRAAVADDSPAALIAPADEAQSQETSVVSAVVVRPLITSVTPGSASAGTHSRVVISGSAFGDTPGKVEFTLNVYGIARMAADTILSWSDSEVACEVPIGNLGGFAVSSGSGPLVVTSSAGVESSPYEFRVPFGAAKPKWAMPTVTYALNTNGLDLARREQLVDAAAASWNAAGSAFALVDGGTTALGAAKDGTNVVCWSDTLPDGVVAMSSGYTDEAGVIQECDIRFSNSKVWGDGIAAGTWDVQSIAVHEFGHWLCLLDQYADADAGKVMYGFVTPGQRRSLTYGDMAGIRWIYPTPKMPVYRFYNLKNGSHFYTASAEECGRVRETLASTYTYEGAAYVVDTSNQANSAPLYRFYNMANGSHFYTVSQAERDSVRATLSSTYTYEGVAYGVSSVPAEGADTVFRFYNKRIGTHFYTTSTAEKDRVIAELGDIYTFEGPAFWVAP